MGQLLDAGKVLARNAWLYPDRIGARDLERSMTFRQWNGRACRLAKGLIGLGLAKGDRVAVLAYNCLEWVEIYAATAKAGLVAVPVNFRLVASEIRFIVENSAAAAIIVEDSLTGPVEEIRDDLPIAPGNYIHFGGKARPAGYRGYEALIAAARDSEPGVEVLPGDPWTLMYTSGTTGRPKGAIRSHLGNALMALVAGVEFGIGRADTALLVMPMCRANSFFYFGAVSFFGGACSVYSRAHFDPEHLVRTLARDGATITSLVPTHYITMLALPAAVRARHDVSRVRRLVISSAPARRDTKLEIMDYFRNSGLIEFYGSTEAGWVTVLHPEEQFEKLGSVGRECVGSAPVRLVGQDGAEVPAGEPGELFSSSPYAFDGYWRLPEKTAEAFRGGSCSVGDLARRDADGYIYLVDRKSNMIISGGENVYPSEVEALLGSHAAVKDVAVIGVPDAKWGERVHAVVILHDGAATSAEDLADWCRTRIAGYKRPRSVAIIRDEEMPRTATGKILHRELRLRHGEAPA